VKAFITGVNGFAGWHLVSHLKACGDQVLGSARAGATAGQSGAGVETLQWDLNTAIPGPTATRIAAFAPDCIYHLGAMSVPAACGGAEPNEEAWRVNVESVRRVVELSRQLANRPRVVLVSSCHVYAPFPQGQPVVNEQSPIGPVRAYGKTKVAAEELIVTAVEQNGADAVIARTFQHTGPRQSAQMMLPHWAQQFATAADPVSIYTANAWLDLSDVRDIVRAYRVLATEGKPAGIYNVGSGVRRRSGDIFQQLCQASGQRRSFTESNPGEVENPIASLSQITSTTSWRPEIPFEQTLRDTLAFWQAK